MSVEVSREHIIAEIKRTAELNGGEPLGVARFFQKTGIKESDWSGKLWARWGDALVEADYRPNKFQDAYPDDYVVQKLVNLIRELGHYPTFPEIKLRGQSDSGFPSQGVFQKRGKKVELIEMVHTYCKEHSGYDDVIAICEPLIVESILVTEAVSSNDIE